MSVVFIRDGVTFSFCLPTALLDSLGVSTVRKKQGLTPSPFQFRRGYALHNPIVTADLGLGPYCELQMGLALLDYNLG